MGQNSASPQSCALLAVAADIPAVPGFAMAFDSYHGFNSSMTFLENKNTDQYANTQCMGFDAAVHHVWPDFPAFNCEKGGWRRK